MSLLKNYWKAVSTDIEKQYPRLKKPVEKWKKREIEVFLGEFSFQVEQACKKNKEKAAVCSHSYQIAYATFRRIFLTKESLGQEATQNIFAVFLGYDSMQDYIVKNNIEANDMEIIDFEANHHTDNYLSFEDVNAIDLNEVKQSLKQKIENLLEMANFRKFKEAVLLLKTFVTEHATNRKIWILNLLSEMNDLEDKVASKELTQEETQVKYNQIRRRIIELTDKLTAK